MAAGRTLLLVWLCSPLLAVTSTTPLGPPASAAHHRTVMAGDLSVELAADKTETYYGATRGLRLRGHARIQVRTSSLAADLIEVVFEGTRPARAVGRGHVVLSLPWGRATGDEGVYDFATRKGSVVHANIWATLPIKPRLDDLLEPSERPHAIYITAASADIMAAPGNRPGLIKGIPAQILDLTQPSIAVQGSNPPQFGVKADRARLTLFDPGMLAPGVDVLKMRHVRLQMDGNTVVGLPDLQLGTGGLYVPFIAYNSTWGLYAQQRVSIGLGPGLRWRVTPRLGTRNGITGETSVEYSTAWGQFAVAGSLRERELQVVSRQVVEYSRWPEVRWTLPAWDVLGIGGVLRPSASWGIYREHGTGTQWRNRWGLDYKLPLHDGPTSAASARLGGQYAFYEHGARYGWLSAGFTVEKNFDNEFWLRLGFDTRWITGATPFRFDRVEAPTTVTEEARWRVSRTWVLQNQFLLDINKASLRGHQVGLLKRDRLLEYGLSIVTNPDVELRISGRVLGF